MDGQRLILKDGTVLENASAGVTSLSLWLWIKGITMQEAAQIALDQTKTKKIIFQYGDEEEVYTGYTSCESITRDGAEISICLSRG